MEYRRFGDSIICRLDKGEEILQQVEKLAKAEDIKLAEVSALGAVGDFTAGVFDVDEKKYHGNDFKGNFEIVSLTGTINTMDGEFSCRPAISAREMRKAAFSEAISTGQW